MSGLNDRNLFSHSSGGWKSEIKGPAGLGFLETFLFGLQMPIFSSVRTMVFPLCTCASMSKFPLLIKHQSYWMRAQPYELIYLNYLFKNRISKYTYILRYWELGLQPVNFGEQNSVHNTH